MANLLTWAGGGLFRYPEKFLFWFALALPLGAGWGLERVLESRAAKTGASRWLGAARWITAARWIGGALAALGLLLFALRSWAVAQVTAQKPNDPMPSSILDVQMGQWGGALLLGGGLLVVAAVACRTRSRWAPAVVLTCQGICLLQLHPLLLVDSATIFKVPADWAPGARAGDQVVGGVSEPLWTDLFTYLPTTDPRQPERYQPALSLAPSLGITRGLGYPLAHNAEGLGSVLRWELQRSLANTTWQQRTRWLRLLGVELLALGEEADPSAGLRQLSAHHAGSKSFFLYAVERPAPAVRWPRRLRAADDLATAVALVANSPDPLTTLILPSALSQQPHDPDGTVSALESTPDRFLFAVESQGGVVALRRAFHPLLRARIEGGEGLSLFPADVFLTGVRVPPGNHRVAVEAAGSGPEIAGGIFALVVALGCLWLARPGAPA